MVQHMSDPVSGRYGRFVTLVHDQIASESIRRYGEWAELELQFLSKLIRRGDCILDVGAYIGTHTLAFAAFTGSGGLVTAFEPRREVFSILEENATRLNTPPNVTLMQCALGAAPGELRLPPLDRTGQAGNPGGAALCNVPESTLDSYSVAVRTIDSLDLQRLDLLKLDVEGAESDVIAGATRSLQRHHPIIYAEANSLDAAVPLLERLKPVGYTAYGCLFRAFNPDNYCGDTTNIFGDAAETALLFVHEDGPGVSRKFASDPCVVAIKSIDSLALLLMHKPQYPFEILQDTTTGRLLGLDLPLMAPLRKQFQAESTARREAVTAWKAEAAARQAEIAARQAETSAREEAVIAREDALRAEAICRAELEAVYRSRSWRFTEPLRRAMAGLGRFR